MQASCVEGVKGYRVAIPVRLSGRVGLQLRPCVLGSALLADCGCEVKRSGGCSGRRHASPGLTCRGAGRRAAPRRRLIFPVCWITEHLSAWCGLRCVDVLAQPAQVLGSPRVPHRARRSGVRLWVVCCPHFSAPRLACNISRGGAKGPACMHAHARGMSCGVQGLQLPRHLLQLPRHLHRCMPWRHA